jgi:hypothetical protein
MMGKGLTHPCVHGTPIHLNKTVVDGVFDMTIGPQMRLGFAENFRGGIVGGIPVNRENERFSMFTRLIWEPAHKH